MFGLMISLIVAAPSEACPPDVDTTLQGICNSLSLALRKNEIGFTNTISDSKSLFGIDSDGKVNLYLKAQMVFEKIGKVVPVDARYSFYIQEVDLIGEHPFACKSGKCIKVETNDGGRFSLSGLTITAFSDQAAKESQRAIEVLQRMFGVPSKDGEPIRITCGKFDATQPSIRVVGAKGDLFEIHQNGKVIYANFAESREWMGGAQNQLQCDDFVLSRDIVVIRLGWKNDLIMAFTFQYDNTGRVVSIWKHDWLIRDGEDIDVSLVGGDVLVRYGRNHDLLTRLCFGRVDKNWRRSTPKFVNAGIPNCDNGTLHSTTKISVQ